MTLKYETYYKYLSNQGLTTARLNSNWEDIDARLDVLEQHDADRSNPHEVDYTDVGASRLTHTHTVYETVAFFQATVATGDPGPHPIVRPASTITSVWATLGTASSSGAVQIDVLKSADNGATWATVFSTKLTIDATEKSSVSAATASVLSVTAVSANDQLKVNIDSAGTGAANLTVGVVLSRTVSQN